MTKSLLLLSAVCFYVVSCQRPQAASEAMGPYLETTRQFIQFVRDSTHTKDTLVLADRAGGHIFPLCEEDLLSDSSFFSPEERKEIRSQWDHPLLKTWTHALIDHANIVPQDSTTPIFKNNLHTAWELFHNQYGSRLTTFSAPIFLRNNTICLFYSETMCGILCGEGRFSIYKKDGRYWKLVRTFCNWVS